MSDQLSLEGGKTVVEIARKSIIEHFEGKNFKPHVSTESELNSTRGVFVTLLRKGKTPTLRGCIGNPFPKASLAREAARCAVSAATEDPRFPPIQKEEFTETIQVEVTVLTPLEHILVKSPLDLPLNITIGRDGLFVEGSDTRGLLLPQVAVDEEFSEEEFLAECCLKAGLMPDAWLTGKVRVARFQGQIFSEESPHGRVIERKIEGTRPKG